MKTLTMSIALLLLVGCSSVPLTEVEKEQAKIYEQIAREEYLCGFSENYYKKYTYRACGGYIFPKKSDPVVVAPVLQSPPLLAPTNQSSKALKRELKGLREILDKK